MARPKPTVIMEYIYKDSHKSEQVLEADHVYAVYYRDKPINLRLLSYLVSYPGPKYKKTQFSNKGYAINLAKRLNKLFKTSDFEVYVLDKGTPITLTDD